MYTIGGGREELVLLEFEMQLLFDLSLYKKQWVTSQPPIAHFNLNLNYEKFICLFTLQKSEKYFIPTRVLRKKNKIFW